jgi:hypothetical protein
MKQAAMNLNSTFILVYNLNPALVEDRNNLYEQKPRCGYHLTRGFHWRILVGGRL